MQPSPLLKPSQPEPHSRKRPADYIRRPRNAFILFRTDFVRSSKLTKSTEADHRNISKIVGTIWRSLPEAERSQWQQKAAVEKDRHRLLYPDYKYTPAIKRKGLPRRKVNQRVWEGVDSDEDRLDVDDGDDTITNGQETRGPQDRCDVIARLYLSGVSGVDLEGEIKRREEEGRHRRRQVPLPPLVLSQRASVPFSTPNGHLKTPIPGHQLAQTFSVKKFEPPPTSRLKAKATGSNTYSIGLATHRQPRPVGPFNATSAAPSHDRLQVPVRHASLNVNASSDGTLGKITARRPPVLKSILDAKGQEYGPNLASGQAVGRPRLIPGGTHEMEVNVKHDAAGENIFNSGAEYPQDIHGDSDCVIFTDGPVPILATETVPLPIPSFPPPFEPLLPPLQPCSASHSSRTMITSATWHYPPTSCIHTHAVPDSFPTSFTQPSPPSGYYHRELKPVDRGRFHPYSSESGGLAAFDSSVQNDSLGRLMTSSSIPHTVSSSQMREGTRQFRSPPNDVSLLPFNSALKVKVTQLGQFRPSGTPTPNGLPGSTTSGHKKSNSITTLPAQHSSPPAQYSQPRSILANQQDILPSAPRAIPQVRRIPDFHPASAPAKSTCLPNATSKHVGAGVQGEGYISSPQNFSPYEQHLATPHGHPFIDAPAHTGLQTSVTVPDEADSYSGSLFSGTSGPYDTPASPNEVSNYHPSEQHSLHPVDDGLGQPADSFLAHNYGTLMDGHHMSTSYHGDSQSSFYHAAHSAEQEGQASLPQENSGNETLTASTPNGRLQQAYGQACHDDGVGYARSHGFADSDAMFPFQDQDSQMTGMTIDVNVPFADESNYTGMPMNGGHIDDTSYALTNVQTPTGVFHQEPEADVNTDPRLWLSPHVSDSPVPHEFHTNQAIPDAGFTMVDDCHHNPESLFDNPVPPPPRRHMTDPTQGQLFPTYHAVDLSPAMHPYYEPFNAAVEGGRPMLSQISTNVGSAERGLLSAPVDLRSPNRQVYGFTSNHYDGSHQFETSHQPHSFSTSPIMSSIPLPPFSPGSNSLMRVHHGSYSSPDLAASVFGQVRTKTSSPLGANVYSTDIPPPTMGSSASHTYISSSVPGSRRISTFGDVGMMQNEF